MTVSAIHALDCVAESRNKMKSLTNGTCAASEVEEHIRKFIPITPLPSTMHTNRKIPL